jgi:hypothetical protein
MHETELVFGFISACLVLVGTAAQALGDNATFKREIKVLAIQYGFTLPKRRLWDIHFSRKSKEYESPVCDLARVYLRKEIPWIALLLASGFGLVALIINIGS